MLVICTFSTRSYSVMSLKQRITYLTIFLFIMTFRSCFDFIPLYFVILFSKQGLPKRFLSSIEDEELQFIICETHTLLWVNKLNLTNNRSKKKCRTRVEFLPIGHHGLIQELQIFFKCPTPSGNVCNT